MPIQIKTCVLEVNQLKANGLIFLPDAKDHKERSIALLTHGVTSHKGSLLAWASRLVENGYANLLFDLPGHYLGGFHPVDRFENFTISAHQFFKAAHAFLIDQLASTPQRCLLAGHSLGGLLALKALEDFEQGQSIAALAVGLGLNTGPDHIFKSDLFEKTMQIRNGLVAPEIHTDKTFPWIQAEKQSLAPKNRRLHFICGQDDVVVGSGGLQRLIDKLSADNHVSAEEPKRLSHHQPELAARYILEFMKAFDAE